MANKSTPTTKASAQKRARVPEDEKIRNDDSLLHIFKNNPTLFDKGRECVAGYIDRNITFEIKKAIAINVMTSAMANLNCGIVQAAELAAHISGYSSERAQKWAFSLFTSMALHSCLEDIDDEIVHLELSSD